MTTETTTKTETINWRNLIVTDSDGDTAGTLGNLVDSAPANLDGATWDDNGISEWPQFFLSAEGEDPSWDTPCVSVDWSGFGVAMRIATNTASNEDLEAFFAPILALADEPNPEQDAFNAAWNAERTARTISEIRDADYYDLA